MRVATTTMRQRDGSIADWMAPLLVFAVACLVYSINLGRMAHPDEYHHILAAQGLVATGEPRIAEGLYTRVFLQTWLVAKSFGIFGESLAAARVPSLVATSLLVALLFVWLRREAGTPAAWIGATLFGLSPFAVEMAQFCRFYALQSLVMVITATVVFAGVKAPADPPWRRLTLFAVASTAGAPGDLPAADEHARAVGADPVGNGRRRPAVARRSWRAAKPQARGARPDRGGGRRWASCSSWPPASRAICGASTSGRPCSTSAVAINSGTIMLGIASSIPVFGR